MLKTFISDMEFSMLSKYLFLKRAKKFSRSTTLGPRDLLSYFKLDIRTLSTPLQTGIKSSTPTSSMESGTMVKPKELHPVAGVLFFCKSKISGAKEFSARTVGRPIVGNQVSRSTIKLVKPTLIKVSLHHPGNNF